MPNRALISDLLALLVRHPSHAGISNAYLSPPLLQNLRVYLEGLIDSPGQHERHFGAAAESSGRGRHENTLRDSRRIYV